MLVCASPFGSRLAEISGRNGFVSYGLVVHLLLLPTPPRDDAVTVGYKPESVYLEGTFTPLTKYAHRRTAMCVSHMDSKISENCQFIYYHLIIGKTDFCQFHFFSDHMFTIHHALISYHVFMNIQVI
jgi:hypothetical protein